METPRVRLLQVLQGGGGRTVPYHSGVWFHRVSGAAGLNLSCTIWIQSSLMFGVLKWVSFQACVVGCRTLCRVVLGVLNWIVLGCVVCWCVFSGVVPCCVGGVKLNIAWRCCVLVCV